MKFTATILQSGKTATGIEVPPRVVAALGSSKKPSVVVTLNGYTYRSTVAVLGGKFMIPVSSEVRNAARVAGGDTLEVEVALDTAPRVLELTEDFALALAVPPRAFLQAQAVLTYRAAVQAPQDAARDGVGDTMLCRES